MSQANNAVSLKVISGTSHTELSGRIAGELGTELCKVEIETFANGETGVKLLDSVRASDVFVIQSHSGNVNDSIIEQALIIDAARRADARSITALCPFMAYARQDRKSNVREPISARLVVDILINSGANKLMSIDLHSGQIQGFMNGPFDHLIARPVIVEYIKKHFSISDLVIVSPDAGRVKSAERYASELGCSIAIVHKYRSKDKKNHTQAKHVIGEVSGKNCVIIDDMIDTAGTLCSAAELLKISGAKEIHGIATHGLFSPPAAERINSSPFNSIIVTDTLPVRQTINNLEILPVAPLIARSIKASQKGESLSALFNGQNQF